ncbi:MAG TPA: FHA domain-containing protein, partial [Acidimicrobiia bacterium]|nr:FHA domain-containing protein [Acidimicrobiia bacterium]
MTLSIETSKGTRDFDGPGPIRIGRDPSAELVVDNPNVSRFHAELRQEDGAWRLIDTNSTQGVFVGGQKVENVALDGRTEVVLGRTDEAERITVTASEPSSNDAATQLPAPPPAGTILPDDAPQRPGGGLRDAEVGAAAGTVVTDQSINVQCAGQSFTFQPGQKAVFGREADCQVTTDNPTVSRHHAELRFDGTYWHLVDLDSSRGTYVDGERITDTYVYGSQAAWLGDPEAGERIV